MSTVQMWGNSLAIRIPTALAGQLRLTDGSTVDLEVREGELVVRPCDRLNLRLKDLLKNCKPSQLHGETDFGPETSPINQGHCLRTGMQPAPESRLH